MKAGRIQTINNFDKYMSQHKDTELNSTSNIAPFTDIFNIPSSCFPATKNNFSSWLKNHFVEIMILIERNVLISI